ncbi:hypothetical protein BLNAU_25138 [Blattamonas nauphoetae]|uniref:Uncharacterized protein n=1 Tax=Blattamonas nauphoetae TaxID=2049346 RepID=A0ABQ9WKF5_9EUKA|nr:hypothetical protein BLNAU_25138 [Blattamonas nauphoetae]
MREEKEQLEREKDQMEIEKWRMEEENEEIQEYKEIMERHFEDSSNPIVAFSSDHFKVSRWSVVRVNSSTWAACTKPVSKGIHRLSIKTEATDVMIGVCNVAEYPKYLTSAVQQSPKAAMMVKTGELCSAA